MWGNFCDEARSSCSYSVHSLTLGGLSECSWACVLSGGVRARIQSAYYYDISPFIPASLSIATIFAVTSVRAFSSSHVENWSRFYQVRELMVGAMMNSSYHPNLVFSRLPMTFSFKMAANFCRLHIFLHQRMKHVVIFLPSNNLMSQFQSCSYTCTCRNGCVIDWIVC